MEPKGLDFEGLAAALLAEARLLVPSWLPGGSMRGHEYICANLHGGQGKSFSVNLDNGKWADFANDGLKGGDLISLYAAIEDIKQGDAAKRLAEKIGYNLKGDQPKAAAQSAKASRVGIPPAGTPAPGMRHGHFGEATRSWCYKDSAGGVLFFIARYDPKDERKQFVPWCWDREDRRWSMKAWPVPRPIYGLDRLSAAPGKPVLVVEGEKAADAAQALAEAYVVVSWPGGAAAFRQVDWTPLHGRRLVLWPDADRHLATSQTQAERAGVKQGELLPYNFQPGPTAMAGIATLLHGHAEEIKIIDVGMDQDRADGWDAADAFEAGWSWSDFIEWAKPRLKVFGPTVGAPLDAQVIPPDAPFAEGDEREGDRAPKNLYAEWEKLGVATASNGSPICNVDNALRVIEGRQEFREIVWYDEFHKRYLTRFDFDTWKQGKQREWSDVDELNLTAFMQRQLGLRRISDDMVHKAAIIHAHRNLKNEPLDWMESLKWDGQPRCDDFFSKCFGATDTEYARAASKNFWVGMVARIFRPGCKLDNMVVFEGAQGAFKSTALSRIGGGWYTEIKESVTDKDFFMVLHGKLIVEIAELDSFNKAEVTRIKQVVTCQTDRYRPPYARGAQDHPRMSIFVGTTNESSYLRDHTGARRFWPIRCGNINLAEIEVSREQLFAEAVARFKVGESWHEMPAEITAREQEARRQVDEWESIVDDFLFNKDQATTVEIAHHLRIDLAKLDMVLQKRIGNVMRSLRWERFTTKTAGQRPIRAWRPENAPIKAELPFEEPAPPESFPWHGKDQEEYPG